MSQLLAEGIVYVATGSKYLSEAHFNASLSKSYAPNIPFAVFTDLINDVDDSIFNFKFKINDPSFSYRDKIEPLGRLPFKNVLFLDTDARLVHTPKHLFQLLEYCDICASPAPVRIPPGWTDSTIPVSFHEFNTGVLLFRNSPTTCSLFCDWLKSYDDINYQFSQSWDQATFRSVLFKYISSRRVSFYSLPSECNLRTTKPWIAGRGSPVYIVHGRFDYDEANVFIDFLNFDIDRFRTFNEWCKLHPSTSIRPRFDRTYN